MHNLVTLRREMTTNSGKTIIGNHYYDLECFLKSNNLKDYIEFYDQEFTTEFIGRPLVVIEDIKEFDQKFRKLFISGKDENESVDVKIMKLEQEIARLKNIIEQQSKVNHFKEGDAYYVIDANSIDNYSYRYVTKDNVNLINQQYMDGVVHKSVEECSNVATFVAIRRFLENQPGASQDGKYCIIFNKDESFNVYESDDVSDFLSLSIRFVSEKTAETAAQNLISEFEVYDILGEFN